MRPRLDIETLTDLLSANQTTKESESVIGFLFKCNLNGRFGLVKLVLEDRYVKSSRSNDEYVF